MCEVNWMWYGLVQIGMCPSCKKANKLSIKTSRSSGCDSVVGCLGY